MRILWCSNAPWVTSGYGVQTRLFVPRLERMGHQMAVFTTYGLEGAKIHWNNILCLPRGLPGVGQDIIAAHSAYWNADITVTLIDAWTYDPDELHAAGVRWVPWFPVDSEPISPAVAQRVCRAKAQIVMSRFGEAACREAGMVPFYVPHGVDTGVFHPRDRGVSRRVLGLPEDRYVITMVGTNRDWPSRKALPQAIEAFARFSSGHPDAVLYLHTSRGDEPWLPKAGVNLPALVEHLGIQKQVFLCNSYDSHIGLSDEHMALVYGATDCLLAPSLGEGFGVPILEAQACGCPVIVGGWTSMEELCFAGYTIPREHSEPLWNPLNSFYRTPTVDSIRVALESMYARRDDASLGEQARHAAKAYDADHVAKTYWEPVLQAIQRKSERGDFAGAKSRLLLSLLQLAPEGAIAEVGCIRHRIEIPGDGFSTYYLARWARERGVPFTSFDKDAGVVRSANALLETKGLPPCVKHQDGAQGVRSLGPLAFLYLDSSDDPGDTLSQFLAAQLIPGAVVVVDDAQAHGENMMGKATLLAQHLREVGVPYEVVPTERGFCAMVVRAPETKGG